MSLNWLIKYRIVAGYIVSIIGPYVAKNNDASILNHIMRQNTEQVRDWLHPGDIMVVDRGFRDSADLLSEIGKNPLLKRKNTDMIVLYDFCVCILKMSNI